MAHSASSHFNPGIHDHPYFQELAQREPIDPKHQRVLQKFQQIPPAQPHMIIRFRFDHNLCTTLTQVPIPPRETRLIDQEANQKKVKEMFSRAPSSTEAPPMDRTVSSLESVRARVLPSVPVFRERADNKVTDDFNLAGLRRGSLTLFVSNILTCLNEKYQNGPEQEKFSKAKENILMNIQNGTYDHWMNFKDSKLSKTVGTLVQELME